jgi:hypothetical protein
MENHSKPKPRKNQNQRILTYLLVVAILVLLFASNPSVADHRDAVSKKVKKTMQRAAANATNSDDDSAGAQLGGMLGGAVASRIVDQLIDRKNFLFFSFTTYNGDEKIIGLGILGNVFLSKEVERRFGDIEHDSN